MFTELYWIYYEEEVKKNVGMCWFCPWIYICMKNQMNIVYSVRNKYANLTVHDVSFFYSDIYFQRFD